MTGGEKKQTTLDIDADRMRENSGVHTGFVRKKIKIEQDR
jgi:hypothetical protein